MTKQSPDLTQLSSSGHRRFGAPEADQLAAVTQCHSCPASVKGLGTTAEDTRKKFADRTCHFRDENSPSARHASYRILLLFATERKHMDSHPEASLTNPILMAHTQHPERVSNALGRWTRISKATPGTMDGVTGLALAILLKSPTIRPSTTDQ